jgi:hypothetical protein
MAGSRRPTDPAVSRLTNEFFCFGVPRNAVRGSLSLSSRAAVRIGLLSRGVSMRLSSQDIFPAGFRFFRIIAAEIAIGSIESS